MLRVKSKGDAKPLYWRCNCGEVEVKGEQKIIVIAMRHGESEHNVKGVVNGDPKTIFHLTEKGREQAQKLGIEFKDKNIVAIIASEMLRTQETAKPLSEAKNIQVQVDPRINDIGAGELEGIPILDFRKITQNANISVKGSETNVDIAKRLKSFLKDLVDCYAGMTVAIVSSEIILHSLKQVSEGLLCDEDSGEHVHNGVAYEFIIHSPVCCPSCGDSCPI